MLGLEQVLAQLNVKGEPPTKEQLAQAQYKLALSHLRSLLMEARRLPGTDTVVQTADERIEAAEKRAEKSEFGLAKLALGDSEKALQQAIVQGRDLQQKRIKQEEEENKARRMALREREPYVTALSQARLAQQTLRGMPGTEPQIGELDKLIDEAEKLAAGANFGDARALLEKGSTSFFSLGAKGIGDLVDNGKEASGKCVSNAQQKFVAAFERQGRAVQMLGGDKYLHRGLRAGFDGELQRAVTPLYARGANPATQKDVLEQLDEIEKRAKAAIILANQLYGIADQVVGGCARALKELSSKATPNDRADLDDRQLRLKALMEQREYQAAIEECAGFVDDCRALNQQVQDAEEAWLRHKGSLDSMAGTCQGWIDNPLPMLAKAQPGPGALLTRIQQLQKASVGTQMSFAQANLLLKSIEGEHAALRQRVQANAGLVEAIRAGELRVGAALATANEEQAKLVKRSDHAVRGATGNPLSTLGEHGPKLDALKERWERNKAAAVTEADLQVDAIETELQQLAQTLKAIEGPDVYMQLLGHEEATKALQEYAKQRKTSVGLLEKLQPWGSPRQASLQNVLDGLDRTAAQAHDETEVRRQCLGGLIELERELRLADSEAGGRHKTLTDEGGQLVAAIEKALKAFVQKLAEYGKSFLTESPQYEAYQKVLENEFNGLKGQLAERDVDIVAAVVADLRALQRRVGEGQQALEGRSLPTGAPTLEEVDKRLRRARDDLATGTLAEYLALTKAGLKAKLDPIADNKLKRPIDVSLDALALWQQQLNQALVQASKAAGEYARLETAIEGARKALNDAKGQFADQPKYLEALKARLTKALAEGKSEGQLEGARQALERIRADIDKALEDPEAMKDGDVQAAAVEELKKQDKASWEGLYEVFTSQTLPAARKVADAGLYKEIARLGKLSQQTFTKTGDLEVARQQLRLASDRAQDAIAYPGGKAQHFRKALAPAEERWKKAVTDFQRQLDELAGAVEAAEPTHGAAMKESARALKGLFLAGAFQTCVGQMNSPGASAEALRAAREDGLVTLRRYRQAVQAQRQMVSLSINPFMTFRALLELDNALFDIERNLLISA